MHPEVEEQITFPTSHSLTQRKSIAKERHLSTSPMYYSEEIGEHSATPRDFLADAINNCSNRYVEVGTDCYDSLTWVESSAYIV